MATRTTNPPGSTPKPVRIILVDDHPLMREGLAEVLRREPDFQICGEAEDRLKALTLLAEMKPDLAIIDLTLKNSHGLDLIKDMAVHHSKTLVLVVSMHDELVNAERALRAGASGYINKQEASTRIVHAIRCVLADGVYLSERAAGQIAAKIAGRPRNGRSVPVSALTDRELQVFELIGKGFATRQIAEQLNLDISTIETYRARIKDKLSLRDALELLQAAISWNSSAPI